MIEEDTALIALGEASLALLALEMTLAVLAENRIVMPTHLETIITRIEAMLLQRGQHAGAAAGADFMLDRLQITRSRLDLAERKS